MLLSWNKKRTSIPQIKKNSEFKKKLQFDFYHDTKFSYFSPILSSTVRNEKQKSLLWIGKAK